MIATLAFAVLATFGTDAGVAFMAKLVDYIISGNDSTISVVK